MIDLLPYMRDIADFPKPGIVTDALAAGARVVIVVIELEFLAGRARWPAPHCIR